MRAHLAMKFHSGHRDRRAIEEISTSLGAEGIETICIARDLENWGKNEIFAQPIDEKIPRKN